MMNPWDRDRAEQREPEQPRGFAGGLAWLVALILGVLGLVAMARHGFATMAVIPIGISLFFIMMFLVGHRREQARLAHMRQINRFSAGGPVLERHNEPLMQPEPMVLPRAQDSSLRRLFDRFDVLVIGECRANELDAKQTTSFLDFAREFLDQSHAARLVESRDEDELERHMQAALERAKLQYEVDHPGAFHTSARRWDRFVGDGSEFLHMVDEAEDDRK